MADFDQMKGFLVVRDAETNAVGAVQSVQQTLQRAFGIEIAADGHFVKNQEGMQFGFVLLPGLEAGNTFCNGTLEDLCCRILSFPDGTCCGQSLLDLADSYLGMIEEKSRHSFRTKHKNRLHAYMSGTDDFVGMKIGEAARANCFDFSSEALDFLKDAIVTLAS